MAETIKKSTIKVLDETSSSGYAAVYPKTSQDQVEGLSEIIEEVTTQKETIYRSFTDLGLEEATATPATIVSAMENGSTFVVLLNSDTSISLAPPQGNCLLKVSKISSVAEFNLTNINNSAGWCGYYDGTTWSGWNSRAKIIVSATEPASGLLSTRDLWYKVIS